jgi:putative DNA modification/repair radical SAM protein
MTALNLMEKLALLADAAKYDASCASSGTASRNSLGGRGVGSTEGSGICHAYAPDGRCISLLKILLTNSCVYDCLYCVNRASSNVRRARFTPDEVVRLTLDFYKRNYIEGLFLSSGIVRSPDYTMEQVVRVARELRLTHDFRGYIHLKTIPDADPLLIEEAGRYADRLSINIELPTEAGLKKLAPEKDRERIKKTMARVRLRLDSAQEEQRALRHAPRFAPAGQSTQMIVGADAASDHDILATSTALYSSYGLRRVYYSAFSPIPDASARLPLAAPPLMREHRLYQADWLLRFYGFALDEILPQRQMPMLDLALDPKTAWALANRGHFPVDVNRADRESLLRIPGLGLKSVKAILAARRWRSLRLEDVARIAGRIRKVQPFLSAADWHPGRLTDAGNLPSLLTPQPRQLALFP